MLPKFHIKAVQVKNFLSGKIRKTLDSALPSITEAGPGAIVGIIVQLTHDAEDLIHIGPVQDILVKANSGYEAISFTSMEEDDTRRTPAALLIAAISCEIGTACPYPTIGPLSCEEDQSESYDLILYAGGIGQTARIGTQENVIDHLRFDGCDISQATIDACFRIWTSGEDSAHQRIIDLPILQEVYKAIVAIDPIHWGDKEEHVALEFNPYSSEEP